MLKMGAFFGKLYQILGGGAAEFTHPAPRFTHGRFSSACWEEDLLLTPEAQIL
jgi:hypothetical protein